MQVYMHAMQLGVILKSDAESKMRIAMELSQTREPREKIERGRNIKAPSPSNVMD